MGHTQGRILLELLIGGFWNSSTIERFKELGIALSHKDLEGVSGALLGVFSADVFSGDSDLILASGGERILLDGPDHSCLRIDFKALFASWKNRRRERDAYCYWLM
jgi:hypothetical protein